jgi:hypothetical protein
MLLCDVAITEAGTNKKTLVGVLEKIWAREIPTVHGPFWLYAKLADLRGKHDIRIDLIHLETESKLTSLDAVAQNSTDSTGSFEFAIPIPATPFPLAGAYDFQLFSDNIFIGRAVVTVSKLTSQASKEQG